MTDQSDPKTVLHRYLQDARDSLVWKLDGLTEREARLPRTPTGNNLLGVLKHCLNVEVGYFGITFGRQFPSPEELIPFETYTTDPQADWYAGEHETKDGLIELYRRIWAFSDETISELPLDAVGRVPWWGDEEVTLHQILVHTVSEFARHAGHADIMREEYDAAVGLTPRNANVPDPYDWPEYVAKLTDLADRS